MKKAYFGYGAAALSFMGMIGHAVGGGRAIANWVLIQPSIPIEKSAMIFMVWHVVSAAFLCLAFFFAWGSAANKRDVTLCALILSVAFLAVGLFAPLYTGVGYGVLPNGFAFVPIILLGWFSLPKT